MAHSHWSKHTARVSLSRAKCATSTTMGITYTSGCSTGLCACCSPRSRYTALRDSLLAHVVCSNCRYARMRYRTSSLWAVVVPQFNVRQSVARDIIYKSRVFGVCTGPCWSSALLTFLHSPQSIPAEKDAVELFTERVWRSFAFLSFCAFATDLFRSLYL